MQNNHLTVLDIMKIRSITERKAKRFIKQVKKVSDEEHIKNQITINDYEFYYEKKIDR